MTLEMHLEVIIEHVVRQTWTPRLSKLSDAPGGQNCANIHAMIERDCRYTWRWQLSKFGDLPGGHDTARM